MTSSRRIDLFIEELVVVGVDVGNRDRFAAAVEREIASLLAKRAPDAWSRGALAPSPRDPAPPPVNPATHTPDAWGRAVAESVHASISPPPSTPRTPT